MNKSYRLIQIWFFASVASLTQLLCCLILRKEVEYDCLVATDIDIGPWSDLHNIPIPKADLILFTEPQGTITVCYAVVSPHEILEVSVPANKKLVQAAICSFIYNFICVSLFLM